MRTLLVLNLWCLLFLFFWPLAVLALLLWPVVWLLSIPLRLIGISVDAVLELFRQILLLPARVLGYRSKPI